MFDLLTVFLAAVAAYLAARLVVVTYARWRLRKDTRASDFNERYGSFTRWMVGPPLSNLWTWDSDKLGAVIAETPDSDERNTT